MIDYELIKAVISGPWHVTHLVLLRFGRGLQVKVLLELFIVVVHLLLLAS